MPGLTSVGHQGGQGPSISKAKPLLALHSSHGSAGPCRLETWVTRGKSSELKAKHSGPVSVPRSRLLPCSWLWSPSFT